MPEVSKEMVALLAYLMSGFIVGWVFYNLTSYKRPNALERVIQAFIFTIVVQTAVVLEKWALLFVGESAFELRPWTSEVELLSSVVTALVIGVFGSWLVNTDIGLAQLRKWKISKRSSHPSEWCGAFTEHDNEYVVLHLKDDRRLYGAASIWPSDPADGHFFISNPSWENGSNPMEGGESGQSNTGSTSSELSGILISVTDVKWVEFVKRPEGVA